MESKIALILLNLMAVTLFAAVPPWDYLPKSALEKRAFHEAQSELHAYSRLPGKLTSACAAALGFGVNLFPWKLADTMLSPSGYADNAQDLFRGNFGKGIHSRGPMASGDLFLLEPILGLEAGVHPVELRFSLANLHIPFVPGAEFRPGFLVIIHRDGLPDMNLVMMPPGGLNGFKRFLNPFEILAYTHHLDRPRLSVQAMAALTFGRVVLDPFTQFVTDEPLRNYSPGDASTPTRETSKRIDLSPGKFWADSFDGTSGDIRKRFEEMSAFQLQPRIFNATVTDQEGVRDLGHIALKTPFRNSVHSDAWFAQHEGFKLREARSILEYLFYLDVLGRLVQ